MSHLVDHPHHYNTIGGVGCITVVENFNFNIGNAMKYLWRHKFKSEPLEDLRKAVWYINLEISRLEE